MKNIVVLILVVFAVAFPRPQTRVAVLPVSDREGLTISKALSTGLKANNKGLDIVSSQNVYDYIFKNRGSKEAYHLRLRQANDLFQKGRLLFDSGKNLTEAQKHLERAQVIYRKSLISEEAFDGVRAAKFYLAMLYLNRKETGRAKQELVEIYIADPERDSRKISKKKYPSNIRNMYQSIAKEYQALSQSSLMVRAVPASSRIYIDGRMEGTGKIKVDNLPMGEHHIRIEAKDHVSFEDQKFLSKGENGFQISLKSKDEAQSILFRPIKKKQLPIEHIKFLDEMSSKMSIDIVVFAEPEKARVAAQFYDLRSQNISEVVYLEKKEDVLKELPIVIDSSGYVIPREEALDESKQQLFSRKKLTQAQLDQIDNKVKKRLPEKKRTPSGESSILKNKWLWVAVGAVAIGAGAAVILRGQKSRNSELIWVK